MKVGILSTLGGGVGKFTASLVNGMINTDELQIFLYLIDRRADYQVNLTDNVRTQYCTDLKSPLVAKIGSLMKLIIRKFPEDIVHCNYVSFAAFLRKEKANMILTMHGPPRPEIESTLPDRLAYMTEQVALSLLSNKLTIVTVSEYSKKIIRQRYGRDCIVIYNGIDCKTYSPTLDKVNLRIKLGFGAGPMVLYVGRLHPMKDPVTLVKAFSIVASTVSNSTLVIVGKGPLKTEIERIRELTKSRIILMDRVDESDLLRLYQAADIFVLPSRGEPFGLVLAEAMASGCACIGTSDGASSELLGKKELLVKPSSEFDLAERILSLIQNTQERKEVSDYLRNRALNLFNIERMVESYHDLYKSLM